VNAHDLSTTFVVRKSKLDSSIQTTRSKEGRVEGIRSDQARSKDEGDRAGFRSIRLGYQDRRKEISPVGSHQNLDVPPRIEPIQLVNQLQHRSLNLVIPPSAIVKPRPSDRIDLVEEDDARLLPPRHLEKLSHHPRALADILLDELRADDSDEGRVGPVGDGSGTEGLSGSWRTEEEDSFGRVDTERGESFGLEQGGLDKRSEQANREK
jgi:hypothetical protein